MVKKLITIWNYEIEPTFLYRDIGMISYSLGRYLGWDTAFACLNNVQNDFYSEYSKIITIPSSTNKLKKSYLYFKFLYKISREYDVVTLIHLGVRTRRDATLLKLFNPKIKVYVKCDVSAVALEGYAKKFNRSKIRACFLRLLEKNIDLYSVEVPEAIDVAKKTNIMPNDVIFITNGYLEDSEMHNKNYEKENIILTVARMGDPDKNTELLLDALSGISPEKISSWKVHLIGNMNKEFKEYLNKVFYNNPHLKDIVIIIGHVNKKDLYKHYSRAKIFCLTSRKEGIPNVCSEAMSFGNYFITSDLPFTSFVTDNGKIGKVFPTENKEALRLAIEEVLDGKIDLVQKQKETIEWAEKTFNWKNIIKVLANKLENLK